MKKLFKGLFTTALAVTFLAGCNPTTSDSPEPSEVVTHLVEFYEDNVGKFYLEVDVPTGTKVAKPADPEERKDYTFDGWWVDEAYSAEFDFDTLIVEDTSIYGKWEFTPEYTSDTRTFHLVGALNNTDVEYINWNDTGEEGTDWSVDSYLTKAEDSNLYSIEIEIGYLGKFKVKIPGRGWDLDEEYNWSKIREEDYVEEITEGDLNNIQVTTAGLYKIEVETTFKWIRVTRLGDAVGDGVRQDPAEGEIADWGIVGNELNNWGETPDISLTYHEGGDYYYSEIVFLPEGQFKLRTDNDWATNHGSHPDNVLPDYFVQPLDEESGEIKAGENIVVPEGKAGYYTFFFDKAKLVVKELSFALRGNALATGWGTDSAPLALVSSDDPVEGVIKMTFAGEYAMVADEDPTVAIEFKAKLAAIEAFDGWSIAFGGGESGNDNLVVADAGNYLVTLVINLDAVTLEITTFTLTYVAVV